MSRKKVSKTEASKNMVVKINVTRLGEGVGVKAPRTSNCDAARMLLGRCVVKGGGCGVCGEGGGVVCVVVTKINCCVLINWVALLSNCSRACVSECTQLLLSPPSSSSSVSSYFSSFSSSSSSSSHFLLIVRY